ncbi:endonuclease domain-containing protein [Phenylobacterium sp.]|uniref:endonuclease domain-containing protein n=1 Tax=Phenylobacterium sp. TaxID=1871053 RepID=UPI00398390F8
MIRLATVKRARTLRRNAPSTERFLWKLLRDRRLGDLKFRRQVPIGPYVADFMCPRHRLIIEADVPFHDVERDAVRDAALAKLGFRVLRFTNSEINAADHRVMNRILAAVGCPSALGDY